MKDRLNNFSKSVRSHTLELGVVIGAVKLKKQQNAFATTRLTNQSNHLPTREIDGKIFE
jgi:hypothetical protein